jgi:hypothetical protein
METPTAEVILERMVGAVQDVRDRLLRATAALDAAGVPYAVAGDQAVGTWMAAADKSALRNSPEVEVLTRRADLMRARDVLELAGFSYKVDGRGPMFLDHPYATDRDSVRILFAREKTRPTDLLPNPDVEETVSAPPFQNLNLLPLVMMCLSSFQTLDRLRLRDLVDADLVDCTWLDRLPPELAERLRAILANPDG